MEVRRGLRQEGGSRRQGRGRGTATSLCLLSEGGPAGEGAQNINTQTEVRRPSTVIWKELGGQTLVSHEGNLPQIRERQRTLLRT